MAAVDTPIAEKPPAAPLDLRSISRAAVVTALGLALPPVFHALHLGHVFLPMYLPILAGAFLLAPRWAVAVGFATPLLSAAATGMPPLMPPVAAWMAVELAAMAGLASLLRRRLDWPTWLVVAIVLVVGRALYLGLVFFTSGWLSLPARLFTLAALLAGWPGMVLVLLVVPPAVRLARQWGVEP
jgi:hypothetical protein